MGAAAAGSDFTDTALDVIWIVDQDSNVDKVLYPVKVLKQI